jgi:AcrR family transcriptional regulator
MRLMEQQRGQGVRVSDIAQAAGVSRQAVYLHFSNRTELLVATVRFADELYGITQRLAPILAATSGVDSLRGLIDFWGNYIPLIYGLARALLDTRATDTAAAAAWDDRMQALRSGCQAVIDCLQKCGELRPELDPGEAVDLLWSLLGIEIWENLTVDCSWSNEHYICALQDLAQQTFVRR